MTSKPRLWLLTLTSIAVAGCGPAPAPLPSVGDVSVIRDAKSPRIALAANETEAVRDLLSESISLLASPELASNAAFLDGKFDKIFLRSSIDRVPLSKAVETLQAPPGTYVFAETNWRGDNGGPSVSPNAGLLSGWSMNISPATIARWNSDDPVERSCAINTVAHEITHTLSDQSGGHIFMDSGLSIEAWKSRRSGQTGSYVIGQLAQCTWLVKNGHFPQSKLSDCVPAFYAKPIFPARGKMNTGLCSSDALARKLGLS